MSDHYRNLGGIILGADARIYLQDVVCFFYDLLNVVYDDLRILYKFHEIWNY